MKLQIRTLPWLLLASALVASGALSACGGADQAGHHIEMASLAGMPDEVQQAPERVQQAYQFAAANPDMARGVPCHCNCGPIGHVNSYDCYVSAANADGSLVYDLHAVTCLICVDITHDTMRLMQEGKSVQQIRVYVENNYARYGPSNMP
jgi:hypothetical protein